MLRKNEKKKELNFKLFLRNSQRSSPRNYTSYFACDIYPSHHIERIFDIGLSISFSYWLIIWVNGYMFLDIGNYWIIRRGISHFPRLRSSLTPCVHVQVQSVGLRTRHNEQHVPLYVSVPSGRLPLGEMLYFQGMSNLE
jgi:hypothetical protein